MCLRPDGVECAWSTLTVLTYAGNPANLAALQDDTDHVFMHGDIGNGELRTGCCKVISPMPLSILPPKATSTVRQLILKHLGTIKRGAQPLF